VPIHDYECQSCGYVLPDWRHRLTDQPPRCPHCGSQTKKLVVAPPFHLKGDGWARDGYGAEKPVK